MSKLKIGVDLDDVLLDTLPAWIARYNQMSGDSVSPDDIKSWDLTEYLKKGDQKMLWSILESEDFWQTVQPIKGAQKGFERLASEHEVVVVTSTYPDTWKYKYKRLKELFNINANDVILAYRKNLIDVDILIDDNPANMDGKYKGVLVSKPHNEWYAAETRVKDWDEIQVAVETIAWEKSL